MTEEEIVSESKLNEAFFRDFVGETSREVIRMGVLKVASRHWIGRPCRSLLVNLGLFDDPEYKLTSKGQAYLYAAFESQGD